MPAFGPQQLGVACRHKTNWHRSTSYS